MRYNLKAVPAPDLRLDIEHKGTACLIRVAGPVDHVQYFKLEEAIQTQLDRKQTTLIVDLSALTYISSAGINVLGHTASQFEKFEGKLCYVRPVHSAQWNFFTMIGVDQLFPWAASLDEALSRVGAF